MSFADDTIWLRNRKGVTRKKCVANWLGTIDKKVCLNLNTLLIIFNDNALGLFNRA